MNWGRPHAKCTVTPELSGSAIILLVRKEPQGSLKEKQHKTTLNSGVHMQPRGSKMSQLSTRPWAFPFPDTHGHQTNKPGPHLTLPPLDTTGRHAGPFSRYSSSLFFATPLLASSLSSRYFKPGTFRASSKTSSKNPLVCLSLLAWEFLQATQQAPRGRQGLAKAVNPSLFTTLSHLLLKSYPKGKEENEVSMTTMHENTARLPGGAGPGAPRDQSRARSNTLASTVQDAERVVAI